MLGEQGYLNDEQPCAPADVIILPMTDDLAPAIALATGLRSEGIRVQLHCEKKKFKAKIGYADKLGIPYVIFLGEDEIAQSVVAVKDMVTGEQPCILKRQSAALRADCKTRLQGLSLRIA